MVVYHNSNHLFEKPNIEMIKANTTNHENGLLGLWFSTKNSWQESFGKYGYEIDIPDDFVTKKISIDEFVKMCGNETDYPSLRDSMIEDGYDTLEIVELSGLVEMGIILNLDIDVKLLEKK